MQIGELAGLGKFFLEPITRRHFLRASSGIPLIPSCEKIGSLKNTSRSQTTSTKSSYTPSHADLLWVLEEAFSDSQPKVGTCSLGHLPTFSVHEPINYWFSDQLYALGQAEGSLGSLRKEVTEAESTQNSDLKKIEKSIRKFKSTLEDSGKLIDETLGHERAYVMASNQVVNALEGKTPEDIFGIIENRICGYYGIKPKNSFRNPNVGYRISARGHERELNGARTILNSLPDTKIQEIFSQALNKGLEDFRQMLRKLHLARAQVLVPLRDLIKRAENVIAGAKQAVFKSVEERIVQGTKENIDTRFANGKFIVINDFPRRSFLDDRTKVQKLIREQRLPVDFKTVYPTISKETIHLAINIAEKEAIEAQDRPNNEQRLGIVLGVIDDKDYEDLYWLSVISDELKLNCNLNVTFLVVFKSTLDDDRVISTREIFSKWASSPENGVVVVEPKIALDFRTLRDIQDQIYLNAA